MNDNVTAPIGLPDTVPLARLLIAIDAGEETLRQPLRIHPSGNWLGHIPFAFWIISALRPRTLVELGARWGGSYLAFCQAIEENRCGTRAHAIGALARDVDDPSDVTVSEDIADYHNSRYGHFSTLIKATSEDARSRFSDRSVDLLHIHGDMNYDSIARVYGTWKGTLSDRALVLLHGTNMRFDSSGVWKFWEELSTDMPHFEFLHSNGLGVLGVGSGLPLAIQNFLMISNDTYASSKLRAYFATLGAVPTAHLALQTERQLAVQRSQSVKATREESIREINSRLAQIFAGTDQRFGESELPNSPLALGQANRELHHAHVDGYSREMALLETKLQALLSRLAASEDERDEAIRKIMELRAASSTAEEAAQYANEQAAKLGAELTAIRTSTIWKASEPYRSVVNFLLGRSKPARSHITGDRLTGPAGGQVVASELKSDSSSNVNPVPRAGELPSLVEASANSDPKFPDLFDLRGFQPSARIAVVMHVYYPELFEELADGARKISEPFDLFVSLTELKSEHLAPVIREEFPEAKIWVFPNRGRDILPFMSIASTGVLFSYDLICKLHTKVSPHRPDGHIWRQHLVSGILPSPEGIASIVKAFREDPDLGLVVSDGQIFDGDEFWDGNNLHLGRLLPSLGYSSFESAKVPFAGGSIFWLRPLVLRDLLALNISPSSYEPEPISPDGTLAHAVERLLSVACFSAGLSIRQSSIVCEVPETRRIKPELPRIVAFYLPQFHPIPENDRWWGRGFTEWRNVTRARPLFEGHRQPRLPGELGFTDLRVPETRQAQADLARSYGISGFCYYYYWFGSGRRLLHRPLDEVLASGEPDFPFMVCWANEPWTRNWDGGAREILVPQDYPDGWEEALAADIAPILSDPRYIRLGGMSGTPMFLIYRVTHLPRPAASMRALRAALRSRGIDEVHLSAGWFSLVGDEELPSDPMTLGCDSFFEFPPHKVEHVELPAEAVPAPVRGRVFDYKQTVDLAVTQLALNEDVGSFHRSVMMGWDNTARRGADAHIFHGATPAHFRRWLRQVVRAVQTTTNQQERLVFVNAWNEWAEGTCLEPDRDFERGWLEAVASALGRSPRGRD